MPISPAKREFFDFLLEAGALSFGAYTLKSGRASPYFFNSGQFRTAMQLERLGHYYALALAAAAPETTIVFGPAYKGIPLCISTALALGRRLGRDVGYLFNRKEFKGYGDKGAFVGQLPGPGDRVALVDDVITDGGTKVEAVRLLREAFPNPIDALAISFDRMERNRNGGSAVGEFQDSTGIKVISVFSVADLEEIIEGGAGGKAVPAGALDQIRAYRNAYGAEAT